MSNIKRPDNPFENASLYLPYIIRNKGLKFVKILKYNTI